MGTSFDRNLWQREYRKVNGNRHTFAYEKSPKGKLMRTYRNMKSRVTGVQFLKSHLYLGLDILPKEDFYSWSLGSEDFLSLYSDWVASGFDRKLSPSVDRIDVDKGYTLGNIRWVTHSENSRLGGMKGTK